MSLPFAVLLYTLPFLALVFVVIVVHEWGHFWVARRLGIKVEAFSIGFGPELFGWADRYGTRYKLCLLPLGGYVKMFGEGTAAGHHPPLNEMERRWSFGHRPIAHRAAVVVAGPLANIVFGVLLIVLFLYGREVMAPAAVVDTVRPASPAAVAGIEPGDNIVAINGAVVGDARALAPTIIAAQGAALVIDVLRDGRPLTVTAPGVTQESPPLALAGLGIATTGYVWRLPNPGPALAGGLARTGSVIEANVRSIVEIVMGIRSLSELAGPVGIAEFSGDTVLSYGILGLLILTAFLSVNVGVVNLLPIPMLDGGHLVFMAIEAARRKPLSPRVMKICSLGGFWALMLLLLVVTGHDLIKLAF